MARIRYLDVLAGFGGVAMASEASRADECSAKWTKPYAGVASKVTHERRADSMKDCKLHLACISH